MFVVIDMLCYVINMLTCYVMLFYITCYVYVMLYNMLCSINMLCYVNVI